MSNLLLEPFEQQLRDCLTHLYDYSFLQNHPLIRQLVPASAGDAHRVQNFRNLIADAIESLKPVTENDTFSKQERFYSILVMRYLKQQSVQHVVTTLYLGERQFYRDHNKAVHMLTQVLLEQTKGVQPVLDSTISIQSEIQRIHTQAHSGQIEAQAFLQKSLDAIQMLVERNKAYCQIRVSNKALIRGSDRGILRQAIIWMLSQLIVESVPGSNFTLAFEDNGEEGKFIFERDDCGHEACPLELSSEQQETLNNLVQALGGRIDEYSEPDDYYRLCLTIPMRQHCVLIIDDNPDAIAIFRSYLAGYPYQLLMASDGSVALQLAQESLPELIILDLMLPQQDGWEILQSLKRHPLTEHIPVLICSVLDTAELAGGLGADGFLRKPPGEAEFLSILTNLSRPTVTS